jgi:hypothetical protein
MPMMILSATEAHRRLSFGAYSTLSSRNLILQTSLREATAASDGDALWQRIRGGASAAIEESDEEIDLDKSGEAEKQEIEKVLAADDEDSSQKPSVVSTKPLPVIVKTTIGNKILDHSIEFNVNRSRNIASVKDSLRRQLPGRPPVAAMQLLLNRRRLSDDVLLDELVDEEDEEEDEGEGAFKLVLELDMVPPVDPKFIAQLDQDMQDLTSSQLLDAYTANEAALYQNAALLMQASKQHTAEEEGDEDQEIVPEDPNAPLISAQIRQQAARLRHDLETSILHTPNAQKVLSDPMAPAALQQSFLLQATQVRGNRVRHAAVSSVKTSLKRQIQHVFNIDWAASVRYFLLFLFFGWFGGRTPTSRAILLLGAPSVFILQARPVKMWIKQILYALLEDPPSIVLSLLPAPQQAILSLDRNKAMKTIYGDFLQSTAADALRAEEEALLQEEDDEDDFVDFEDEEESGDFDDSDEEDFD